MSSVETIRLVIQGDSKGAQNALTLLGGSAQKADTMMGGFRRGLSLGSGQSITMRDRLGLLNQGFTKLKTQGLSGATGAAQNFGTALSGIGQFAIPAAAGIGAVALGVDILAKTLTTVVENGMTFVGQIASIARVSGMTADDSTKWWNRMRLVGIAADTGQRAMFMFQKSLYAARQEGSPTALAFQKLGVALKDANGKWRPMGPVLDEVRSKMSKLNDKTLLLGLGTDLFKKSFKDVQPMFTRTNREIKKYDGLIKDAHLKITDEELKQLKELNTHLRTLAERSSVAQIQVSTTLVPALEWMARKADLAWAAIDKLIAAWGRVLSLPGLSQAADAAKWFVGGLIPGKAAGGHVPPRPGGTLTILGEGGEGEDVVPASKRVAYAQRVLGAGATAGTLFIDWSEYYAKTLAANRPQLTATWANSDAVTKLETATKGLAAITEKGAEITAATISTYTAMTQAMLAGVSLTSTQLAEIASRGPSKLQKMYAKQYLANPPANAGQGYFQPGQTGKEVARARDAFDKALDKQAKPHKQNIPAPLQVHNHFHGPVVGGKAGLRELTDIVNRTLGPQVDRLQRGRFAAGG